jgi:hypothetical protein
MSNTHKSQNVILFVQIIPWNNVLKIKNFSFIYIVRNFWNTKWFFLRWTMQKEQ